MAVKLVPTSPIRIEIFAIDDEEAMTDVLELIFQMHSVSNYRLFNDPYELLENLNDDVHIVIVDYKMPKMNGLDLIKKIAQRNKHCFFIMLSGQSDKKIVIEYMNAVFGGKYIEKGDAVSLEESLIFYLKEIIQHINYIDNFYYSVARIKEGFADMKNILNDS